jgi:hypothetical protein
MLDIEEQKTKREMKLKMSSKQRLNRLQAICKDGKTPLGSIDAKARRDLIAPEPAGSNNDVVGHLQK